MKVLQNAFAAGNSFPRSVIAIGKFDGMHLGHQEVIRRALAKAKELNTKCLVVTFDPSPDEFLRLYSYQPILSPVQKLEILKKMGVDAVVLLPFNKKLSCLAPEAFAKDVLAMMLKPAAVIIGEDFCFGKDRAGRIDTLEKLGPKLGFSVHSVPLTAVNGEKISASMIRRLLEEGKKSEAEKLLGWKLKE